MSSFGLRRRIELKSEADFRSPFVLLQVSYAMPALHPAFPIRSQPLMGNHTPGFTAAAREMGAHDEALRTAVGLVGVAVRVLTDETFEL